MKKVKLTLEQQFTIEEYKILEIMHEVLYKTKDQSIYLPWVKTLEPKELSVVLHHLLFSCRDFLGSIFTLMHDNGYHASYVIGGSLVEYFIDFSFILSDQENINSRAQEYFNVMAANKKPFSKDKNFNTIEKRAKASQLPNLYNKTYKSLCSFKHVDLKGHMATRRDKKLTKDRKKFMLQMTNLYLEMWQKLRERLNTIFLDEINDLLDKEFIEIEKLIKEDLNS